MVLRMQAEQKKLSWCLHTAAYHQRKLPGLYSLMIQKMNTRPRVGIGKIKIRLGINAWPDDSDQMIIEKGWD